MHPELVHLMNQERRADLLREAGEQRRRRSLTEWLRAIYPSRPQLAVDAFSATSQVVPAQRLAPAVEVDTPLGEAAPN